MTEQKARQIIADNYRLAENSLCYRLAEECVFSDTAFLEYCDAITFVTLHCSRTEELSAQVAIGYQRFLKEILWHFAPNDVAVLQHFPENFPAYIERLDFTVRAYLEGKPQWLWNARFDPST